MPEELEGFNPPRCRRCHLLGILIKREVAGSWLYGWRCPECKSIVGDRPWVSLHALPDGWEDVAVEMNRAERVPCAKCGLIGAVQLHHWAPREAFGMAADDWPMSPLCAKCHEEWHEVIREHTFTKPPPGGWAEWRRGRKGGSR